ncbi:nicotinate phosphoribosyltransferase-like isoform 1, partial [Reticulomyxa filosa]
LKVYAIREGDVVFSRVPMIRVEGPVAMCQLIETTLLNCVNFASLIATNAARMREAVIGKKPIQMLEFGLRRAQGPDGAMSASQYAYLGGFDSTSNVLAGINYDIAISGTHAHSFVTTFSSLDQLQFVNPKIQCKDGKDLKTRAVEYRKLLNEEESSNEGELTAFIAYANAFPTHFLALIDTYNTLDSGLINFMSVALALHEAKCEPIGVRLDSGDLSYLSQKCREYFRRVSQQFQVPFENLTIVASNDINEEILYSLNVCLLIDWLVDAFGIGTNLVTCQKQPALGCVYKLVAIDGLARIKISEEIGKMTLPGTKSAYRLYIHNNEPLIDLLVLDDEANESPTEKKKSRSLLEAKQVIRCYHPSNDLKRVDVVPDRIEPLLIKVQNDNMQKKKNSLRKEKLEKEDERVWDGKLVYKSPSLKERRAFCMERVKTLRSDYKRVVNPTPYKVSISKKLKDVMKDLIEKETPVRTIQ